MACDLDFYLVLTFKVGDSSLAITWCHNSFSSWKEMSSDFLWLMTSSWASKGSSWLIKLSWIFVRFYHHYAKVCSDAALNPRIAKSANLMKKSRKIPEIHAAKYSREIVIIVSRAGWVPLVPNSLPNSTGETRPAFYPLVICYPYPHFEKCSKQNYIMFMYKSFRIRYCTVGSTRY